MIGLLALVCAATAGAATHGHLTPGEQKEHAEEALQAAKRHHQEFAAAVHQRERKAALQEKLSRLEGPASAGPHEVARQDTTVLRMPAMETDSVTGLTFVGRRKLFGQKRAAVSRTVTEFPTPYGMDYVFEISGASGPTLCLAVVAAALVALLA